MRLSLLLLALTACGPALTMKRLAPPTKALGSAHTVRLEVVPASNDTIPNDATRVSDEVKRQFADRVTGVGYRVCMEPGCGDGVLQVILSKVAIGATAEGLPHRPSFSMMDDAMRAVRGQLAARVAEETKVTITVTETVPVVLEGSVAVLGADGRIERSEAFSHRHVKLGTPFEAVREAVGTIATSYSDGLTRQLPLSEVPLEGGGELNRGVELLHKADWRGAVRYFTELTRLHPELHGGWYDLGFALEAQNQWRQALDAYETAVRLEPKPHYERAALAMRRLVPLVPK